MSSPGMVEGARDISPGEPWDHDYEAIAPRVLPIAKDHSWHLAVGGFLFFIGGAMLVAPHEYDVAWRVLPLRYPAWWGSLYLLAGLALLALPALLPEAWFSAAAYVAGAFLMLALATVYASAGRLIGVAGYLPLAAGCLVAFLLTLRHRRLGNPDEWDAGAVQADLLRSALGLCGALAGLVLLAAPGQSADPAFDPIRPFLPWSGLLLLVAGSALAALPLIRLPHAARLTVIRVASLGSAVMCLVYVIVAVRQAGNWPGIAYFGWLGLILGAQPALATRASALPAPGSLRTRLAFLLAAAAAVPLILMVAFVSDRMERAGRAEALVRQETQAVALAQGVASYVELHQAGLNALAGQPGLAEMRPQEQIREIQLFHEAYPGALSFTLYRADGSPIAASDGDPATESIAGLPIYEDARATRKPSMQILVSPALKHPVFDFAAPIFDQQGRFAGLVTTALDSSRVSDLLARESRSQGRVYMVSDKGRAIVYPDPALVASFADLSATPPIHAALATGDPDSSLSYTLSLGEQLAGYARVPGLAWVVVVENSADAVLADTRASRALAFFMLVISILATAVLGWWVAGRLAAPLADLADASAALARGDTTAPLPVSGIAEADYLAATFGAMRRALVERSTKLQKSEFELRVTADQLIGANRALRSSHEQLRALTRRLLEVQEEERRTLSRDLHDTAAQSMTALGIGLTLLERQTSASPEQLKHIESLRQTADAVMEDLHRLALNLRPSSLDRFGLVPALEQLLESFRKQSGAETDLLVEGMGEERLPGDVETTLYRIVQESLTNIGRHAGASHVDVIVQKDSRRVKLVVEDDGAGFDVDEALQRGRLGLLGMRERAEMLSGTLAIESKKGGGSAIYADLPLAPE